MHILRSKTGQATEGSVIYLGLTALASLPGIRPQEAVIDPGVSVFGLLVGQISQRIKAATNMAGLGDGFSADSPRVGMALDSLCHYGYIFDVTLQGESSCWTCIGQP